MVPYSPWGLFFVSCCPFLIVPYPPKEHRQVDVMKSGDKSHRSKKEGSKARSACDRLVDLSKKHRAGPLDQLYVFIAFAMF